MDAGSALTEALLAAGTVVIFFSVAFVCLYRVVQWARRQKKRAYVIGAALAPFIALGNVSDPDFRIVQEAKRLKNREDDNPGDPPDPDDEQLVLAAATATAKKQDVVRKKEVITIAPKLARPALVWVLSIVLGFAAVLASLVLSWLLLSDPSSLSLEARLVRGSLSVLDWAPLYIMYATLLTSMVMLFRLRSSSVGVFAVYLVLGVVLTVFLALGAEQKPYFDIRVTLFGGMPLAIAVLVYMLRLKKRAILA